MYNSNTHMNNVSQASSQATINDLKMTNQTLTKEKDNFKVKHTPNNISDNKNNYYIRRCNSNTYGYLRRRASFSPSASRP